VATKQTSGKVIRISPEVHDFLRSKWRKGVRGWDDFFRTLLGFESRRKGEERQVLQVWYLRESGQGFEKIADARGAAVVNAVKAKRKKPEEPVRMMELPW
jgi:hypothetical protein